MPVKFQHFFLYLFSVALVAACGGDRLESAADGQEPTHALASDEAFVDEEGIMLHSATARAVVDLQEVLADRIRAAREQVKFPLTVDMGLHVVNYEQFDALTRSRYFELETELTPMPFFQLQISNQRQVFPDYGANFGFTDVRLVKDANTGELSLVNNTPRTFDQMLFRQSNGVAVAVDFGNDVILPFSVQTLSGQGLTGAEVFYDTANLFRPVGYRHDANLNTPEECNVPGSTSRCYRQGTPTEQRRLENTLARIKFSYNVYETFAVGTDFSRSTSGCLSNSYLSVCNSMGNDPELYIWSQMGKMALHPRGTSSLGFMVRAGSTVGLAVLGGNGGWMRFTSNASGTYDVVHHEAAHNYGFSHGSGLTYGMSTLLDRRSRAIASFQEKIPRLALIATRTNAPNTWMISLVSPDQTAQQQARKTFKFMLLSQQQGFSIRLGRSEGNHKQFFLTMERKPSGPVALIAYPENGAPTEAVSSVILLPS